MNLRERISRVPPGTLVGLVLAALAVGVALLVLALSARRPEPPLPRVTEDWALRALDGAEVSLAGLRGKVVFVNIWATWCRPCVTELPSIRKLYQATKGEGVVFLLASPEEPEQVRDFVREKGWDVPVYTFRAAPPKALLAQALPATFILNRRGEVAFKHFGAARWDDEEARRLLRDVLRNGRPGGRR